MLSFAQHYIIGSLFFKVRLGGEPFSLEPLVKLRPVEIEFFTVGTEVRDLPGAGEFVEVALAEFEVLAGLFEIEDFFLKERLPDEQLFDSGEFFENVSLLIHYLFFSKGSWKARKRGVVQPVATPFEYADNQGFGVVKFFSFPAIAFSILLCPAALLNNGLQKFARCLLVRCS